MLAYHIRFPEEWTVVFRQPGVDTYEHVANMRERPSVDTLTSLIEALGSRPWSAAATPTAPLVERGGAEPWRGARIMFVGEGRTRTDRKGSQNIDHAARSTGGASLCVDLLGIRSEGLPTALNARPKPDAKRSYHRGS